MQEWLGFALAVVAIGVLFWLVLRLLRRSQAGHPNKRGQDSSEPGNFYSDNYSSGPD